MSTGYNFLDSLDGDATTVPGPPAGDLAWVTPGEAEGVDDDHSHHATYYASADSPYRWRTLPLPDGTWVPQVQAITPWTDIEDALAYQSLSEAREAVEEDVAVDYDNDETHSVACDHPVPAPPEVSRGLVEGLDALAERADLSARERALVIAATSALRLGVIDAAAQEAWS